MKCPACDGALTPETRAGVEIDLCYHCGGIWLDHGELDSLLSAEERSRVVSGDSGSVVIGGGGARPQAVRYRKCPRCAQWLRRENYRRVSGVIVDTCVAHGLWLDKGELERLATFHASGDGVKRAARFEASEKEHLDRVDASVRSLNRYVRRTTVGRPFWVDLV